MQRGIRPRLSPNLAPCDGRVFRIEVEHHNAPNALASETWRVTKNFEFWLSAQNSLYGAYPTIHELEKDRSDQAAKGLSSERTYLEASGGDFASGVFELHTHPEITRG